MVVPTACAQGDAQDRPAQVIDCQNQPGQLCFGISRSRPPAAVEKGMGRIFIAQAESGRVGGERRLVEWCSHEIPLHWPAWAGIGGCRRFRYKSIVRAFGPDLGVVDLSVTELALPRMRPNVLI